MEHSDLLAFLSIAETRNYSVLPKNWKVFLSGNTHGFQVGGSNAVAFINKQDKELLIAYSGSALQCYEIVRSIETLKIWVDIYSNGIPTSYMQDGLEFLRAVVNKLHLQQKMDYHVVTTGYATGAILSDLSAIYTESKGFVGTESYAYESPGSEPMISVYAELLGLDIHDARSNYHVVNSGKNLLNSMNPDFGDVIYLKSEPSSNSIFSYLRDTLHEAGAITGFASSALTLVTRVATKIFGGHVNVHFQKLQTHNLDILFNEVVIKSIAHTLDKMGNIAAAVHGILYSDISDMQRLVADYIYDDIDHAANSTSQSSGDGGLLAMMESNKGAEEH